MAYAIWLGHYPIRDIIWGPIPQLHDCLIIGYYHEAGWYEDGTGDYASYGETTETEDVGEYTISPWQYDDAIMRQAQKNVDASGRFKDEDFSLFHNCQDYADALRKEYKKLGGKVKFRPSDRKELVGKKDEEKEKES